MCDYTDGEWVRLLKQEPVDAAALVCAWEDIYRFCFDQTRRLRLDEQFAVDAAHETLRRLLRSLRLPEDQGGFGFRCSLRSFWRLIAARHIKTLRAGENKHEQREVLLSSFGEQEPPGSLPAPAARADQSLIFQRLRPCLDALPERQYAVISLRYLTPNAAGEWEEMSPAIVADHLGITRDAVNVAATYARQALRRCLEGRGYPTAADVLSL